MMTLPFNASETRVVGALPSPFPGVQGAPVFSTPVSSRDNFLAFMAGKKPLWLPSSAEIVYFCPEAVPDNAARGQVSLPGGADDMSFGGKDMFDIEWEYVPQVRGSMVRPGTPRVPDIEHWEDSITFPDIDSWDWEGCARATEGLRPKDHIICISQFTGLFERLISFADMTDALVSMVDEDGQLAVRRLFDRLCGLYEALFEKYERYFAPDMVWFHDDWGSQRAPFFSPDTVREMLLPYLKRVTESAHRHGMLMQFHSCGKLEMLVPIIAEAGVDIWDGQDINDKRAVLAQCGKKLKLSIAPPVGGITDEDRLRTELQAFVSELIGTGAYADDRRDTTEAELKIMYELSRRALCG